MNTILICAAIAFFIISMVMLSQVADIHRRGRKVVWAGVFYGIIFYTVVGAGVGTIIHYVTKWLS